MQDYKSMFLDLKNQVVTRDEFKIMAKIKENSPYHREESIMVHTEMVVGEYINRIDRTWTDRDYMGAIAALFHDVGKPAAMIKKTSEERGEYLAFHGHELVSARMWENYAINNLSLPREIIYQIGWMIEHHVPWSVKDINKLRVLATTARSIDFDTFVNVLMADQIGRIADGQEQKLAEVDVWLEKFRNLESLPLEKVDDLNKVVLFPIGPSGSGKTTWINQLTGSFSDRDIVVHSKDLLRLEWYPSDNYADSWNQAVNDKTFMSRVNQHYTQLIKQKTDVIIVDNTNLTAKARRFYVSQAKQHGYATMAYLFMNPLTTLIDRQSTREDKTVPASSVFRQHMSLQYPSYGEFDVINIVR